MKLSCVDYAVKNAEPLRSIVGTMSVVRSENRVCSNGKKEA
jgi:hypothetical protein